MDVIDFKWDRRFNYVISWVEVANERETWIRLEDKETIITLRNNFFWMSQKWHYAVRGSAPAS